MSRIALSAFIGLLPAVASAQLVNHWTFDEAAGAVATDSGSGGNDGAIGGSVLLGATGKIDGAFDFQALGNNAANSVVATGYKGILSGDARTVSAWIRPDALGGQQGVVGWGTNSGGTRWELTRNGSGPRTNVNAGNLIGAGGQFNTSDWFHVVISLPDDGSTNIIEGTMYVDGAVAPLASSLDEPVNTASGIDLRIGRGQQAGTFNGLIDDVAIWGEDLSAGEVKGLFDVGDNTTLNYGAGKFDVLKQLHDGTLVGPQEIDGLEWDVANGLTGPLGLTESDGTFTLVLDDQNDTGVVGSAAATIPEPASIAIWSLMGVGLAGFGYRRFRHNK